MATINDGYVTIGYIAMEIDISPGTIRHWLRWYKNPKFYHADLYLPDHEYKNRSRTMFFKEEDIKWFKDFRDKIKEEHRGLMAEYNAVRNWGKRGDRALRNKNIQKKEVILKFHDLDNSIINRGGV